MNLLLLSGSNKRGKEWLQQVDEALAPQFGRTLRHNYAHWENNEPEIDLDRETTRLAVSTQNLSPYMVFAKSAGTIVTCKAASMDVLQPRACLFVGLPLMMIQNHELPAGEWLREANFPITILQHTGDPLGSYKDVKQYIETVGNTGITVHELPGNTHDYGEFEIIRELTRESLNRSSGFRPVV